MGKVPSPVATPALSSVLKMVWNGAAATGAEGWARLRERMRTTEDMIRSREEDTVVQTLMRNETVRRQANDLRGLPPTYHEGPAIDVEAVKQMPHFGLPGTDMKPSLLAMGMSAAAGSYGRVERKAAIEAVQEAYRLGVNFFDTAPIYGHDRAGEKIIKEALAGIPRESYYLCTKVGRYLEKIPDTILGGSRWRSTIDYTTNATFRSMEQSLEACGVDYFDAVFVHDPHYCDEYSIVKRGALYGLQELEAEGVVRYTGVSGYDLTAIALLTRQERKEEQQDVKIPRAINLIQVAGRYNIMNNTLTQTRAIPYRFLEHMENSNIGIINAAPMAMGLFTPQGPPGWHSADKHMKQAAQDIAAYCAFKNVDITRICMVYAFKQTAIAPHLVGLANVDEVRNAVEIARSTNMTKGEAHCLNWALNRIEQLPETIWKEKDALWNGSGWVSDKAKYAQHYSDEQAAATQYVRARGRLTNPKYLYAKTPLTTLPDFDTSGRSAQQ